MWEEKERNKKGQRREEKVREEKSHDCGKRNEANTIMGRAKGKKKQQHYFGKRRGKNMIVERVGNFLNETQSFMTRRK